MCMTILSWNMQGWSDGKKEDALFKMIEREKLSNLVILLQECGNPKTNGLSNNKNYNCHGIYTDFGAKNLRCSTAILTYKDLKVLSKGHFLVGNGLRPCVYIECEKIIIATIHCIANELESVTQTKFAMIELEKLANGKSWILMGDFNAQPNSFATGISSDYKNEVLFAGTKSRSNSKYAWMMYPQHPTQGAGAIKSSCLDYMFMSYNTENWNVQSPLNENIYVENYKIFDEHLHTLSDHNAIITQISIY